MMQNSTGIYRWIFWRRKIEKCKGNEGEERKEEGEGVEEGEDPHAQGV